MSCYCPWSSWYPHTHKTSKSERQKPVKKSYHFIMLNKRCGKVFAKKHFFFQSSGVLVPKSVVVNVLSLKLIPFLKHCFFGVFQLSVNYFKKGWKQKKVCKMKKKISSQTKYFNWKSKFVSKMQIQAIYKLDSWLCVSFMTLVLSFINRKHDLKHCFYCKLDGIGDGVDLHPNIRPLNYSKGIWIATT